MTILRLNLTPLTRALCAVGIGFAMNSPALAAPTIQQTARVAKEPYEIVVNPVTDRLYVAAYGVGREQPQGQGIVVIHPETLEVDHTIAVPEAAFGLGINTVTQRLYSSNALSGKITVFDLKTGSAIATIQDGDKKAHLRQVVVDEASNTIYVTTVGGFTRDPNASPPDSQVWVIDGATNTLAHTINAPVTMATGLALDAGAGRLYVTDMLDQQVAVIDTKSREVVQRFASGGEKTKDGGDSTNVDVDPAGGRLFVTHQMSGTLAVLESATGKLIKTIPTGKGALAVKYVGPAKQIYVTNRNAQTTTVIDSESYEVLAQLETGSFPQSLAYDAKRGLVYVTNKPKSLPRNAPADAQPIDDPRGDSVSIIKP